MKYSYSLMCVLSVLVLAQCTSLVSDYPVVTLPPNADPEHENWKGIDLSPKPPVKPLSVSRQQKTFMLPDGYSIEAVLSEPQIQQPGAITFDGNGRMYVLELRSYMLTADADDELKPLSGISRWEDKNGDGVYESGGMFVDNLVFPRFVLPVGPNSILTMESNTDNVYLYTDTDNDGKADKKEFFTDNFGRAGNVEHQQAFLYWGMDNWLYSTVNAFRVRWTPDGVIRETTGSNKAQWGIAQDDDGKLWFQGGASGLPSYFQFPIHYGDFIVENQFAEGFDIPWGAPIYLADMQGGMDQVRMPDGSLNRVTGAAGNDIFRGHRLGDELIGQYFYGEPVARIVRQINPVVTEGLTQLENVYQSAKSEFLRSTDPLFRPVDMATAPDGTMYVVDMYHGIIQEGQWIQPGSYLRTKIEQYQLDKVVGLGRIWRITRDGMSRDTTRPQMYSASLKELISYLSHPNGWWRDMAQQVIVQRRDLTIVPLLKTVVLTHENTLARIHALWALEGLFSLDVELLQTLFSDSQARIRIHAMYASETLYKQGETSLGEDYLRMINDADYEVAMRAMMTANLLKVPGTKEKVKSMLASSSIAGVKLVADQILQPPVVQGFFAKSKREYSEEETVLMEQGLEIHNGLCATCHGARGAGIKLGPDELMAPSFISSERIKGHPDYIINVLLKGLVGPIDGEDYGEGLMIPMGSNSDEWVAAIASFVRESFENEAGTVLPSDVARVRKQSSGRNTPFTFHELNQLVPHELEPDSSWTISASHSAATRIGGTAEAFGAFSFEGWTTGIAQAEGMWFQIEMPQVGEISEIRFKSPNISRGWREGSPPPLLTHPRKFLVQASLNGVDWTQLHAPVLGEKGETTIRLLEKQKAKYIRLQLLDVNVEENEPWSMRELILFGNE